MSQERPYINKLAEDLEIISKSHWNNLNILKLISFELSFRNKQQARILSTKVSARIKELEKPELQRQKNIVEYRNLEANKSDREHDINFSEGILGYLGYKVGYSGLPENQRHQILKRVLMEDLPSINSLEYMKDWGNPKTETRRKKMVDSISMFIHNTKGRRDWESYKKAITDWENDLVYLKKLYDSLGELPKDYYQLYLQAKAKIAELMARLDATAKNTEQYEEVVFILNQSRQEIQNYHYQLDEQKKLAEQSYQTFLNEQKKCQQVQLLYDREKAKAGKFMIQRDTWEQSARENQEAASKLVKVKKNIQNYGIKVKELEAKITENYNLYLQEQVKYREANSQIVLVGKNLQKYEIEMQVLEERVQQNYQMYLEEQEKYQNTLSLYSDEKAKTSQLSIKFEEVAADRDKYINLYKEAQTELKFERRSKASIKGWQTRRKTENQQLKEEITEMIVLLQQSIGSKDEAINNLYVVAERMDRIQSLLDSTEEETTNNPVGIIQKFKRIWLAIQEILAE